MMVSVLLAASLSFTATATGVEKGTPIEFVFAGKNTDRDYESMFLIDQPVTDFCKAAEKAGLPVGKPVDPARCRLWPVGCRVKISPDIHTFIEGKMPEGLSAEDPIYTGGTRGLNGIPEATTNMPASVFSIYSLAQSPIVHNGVYNQGAVYGAFTAKDTLKKGERHTFTLTWDETSMPRSLHLTVTPGNAADLIRQLRAESAKGELDVLVSFDGDLTVREARAAAKALATLDSKQVKINGCDTIFYRSFLPLVKWLDRKERLTQPFELTLGNPDKLVFIEEDWSGPGDDPVLTPKEIPFADAAKHDRTDTCFIYAWDDAKVSRILDTMSKLKGAHIRNWYVYSVEHD